MNGIIVVHRLAAGLALLTAAFLKLLHVTMVRLYSRWSDGGPTGMAKEKCRNAQQTACTV